MIGLSSWEDWFLVIMEFGSGIFLKKVLGHQIRDGFVNKNFNFRIIKAG
jgi:hypothetical protein